MSRYNVVRTQAEGELNAAIAQLQEAQNAAAQITHLQTIVDACTRRIAAIDELIAAEVQVNPAPVSEEAAKVEAEVPTLQAAEGSLAQQSAAEQNILAPGTPFTPDPNAGTGVDGNGSPVEA